MWEASVIIRSAAQIDQSDAVASINEHLPFYKVTKPWDDNTTLSEVYKLQSNNSQNKRSVKIHKDNGKYLF